MKKLVIRAFLALSILGMISQTALAARYLIPVGQIVGLELRDDTVVVAAFDDTLCAGAKEAGIRIGDEIVAIDGQKVNSIEDVRRILTCSDGCVELTVRRDGKETRLSVEPAITTGGPRLGVYLKQGISGIGTVTWYDPANHTFGALGHGVNSADGDLVKMTAGNAFPARLLSVDKGEPGDPGQLKGTAAGDQLLGPLNRNTEQGVFGKNTRGWQGQPIETAESHEIKTGPATIRSTVSENGVQEYSVEILKVYPKNRPDGRNLLLRVTDKALLETTGGIVQGMSGSPIIQNGKIVGAVTHVLVNDPTTGYGIFIENMLDAAA